MLHYPLTADVPTIEDVYVVVITLRVPVINFWSRLVKKITVFTKINCLSTNFKFVCK